MAPRAGWKRACPRSPNLQEKLQENSDAQAPRRPAECVCVCVLDTIR